jgi:hypothetical protein
MVSAYVLVSVEPGQIQGVISALQNVGGVSEMVLTTFQGIPGIRATETHVVAEV